jgi:phosphoglycolate phosphatase
MTDVKETGENRWGCFHCGSGDSTLGHPGGPSMGRKYTHIIWDFNGTVLDDVALSIRCVNRMLEKRGLTPVPDEASYRRVFQFPIMAYYRSLGFDMEKEDYYTVLAPEWVAHYLAEEGQCAMMSGVRETLERLRQAGLSQVMISATELNQLRNQLHRLGITEYFQEILGLDNIHAGSKREVAQAWARRHPEAVPLFVGDTVHDAEVADGVGADCVLYTGGHQSEKRLSQMGKPLIHGIAELQTLLCRSQWQPTTGNLIV